MEKKTEKTSVVDLGEARARKIEEKRRNVERILFRNLMGVYTVADNEGLTGVQLVDVSREGLSFQVPWKPGQERPFTDGETIQLRLYFGQETFLPTAVNVRYAQEVLEAGQTFLRYGGVLDRDFRSFEAVEAFIDFIYKYAEHGKPEDGKMKLLFV